MRNDRCRAQALAMFAVVALHVGLLGWLVDASKRNVARDLHSAPVERIALRMIPAPQPRLPSVVATPVARTDTLRSTSESPASTRARPTPSSIDRATNAEAPRANAAPAEPPAVNVDASSASSGAATSDVAALAASAAAPAPSLLDTEATRRAIRASARAPSLGDQLARARDEPDRAGAQARLANGVQSAGRGDCLKGDFPGAGMGLLSLPFLVAAEARGACAK